MASAHLQLHNTVILLAKDKKVSVERLVFTKYNYFFIIVGVSTVAEVDTNADVILNSFRVYVFFSHLFLM